MLLGNFSVLQMPKYNIKIQQSGHTASQTWPSQTCTSHMYKTRMATAHVDLYNSTKHHGLVKQL